MNAKQRKLIYLALLLVITLGFILELRGYSLELVTNKTTNLISEPSYSYSLDQHCAYASKERNWSVPQEDLEFLELVNPRGNVRISGYDGDELVIKALVNLFADNQEIADKFIDEVSFIEKRQGNRFLLETIEPLEPGLRALEVHYQIQVPHSLGLDLRAGFGNIEVSGLTNRVEARLEHAESVVFQEISNSIGIAASFVGLHLKSITGHVQLAMSHSELTGSNLGGDLDLSSSHSTTLLTGIRGEARVQSGHDSIDITDIKESVDLKSAHSSIELQQIGGVLYFNTSFGKLTASEVASSVRGTTSFAPVELELAPSLGFTLQIAATDSRVHSNLPLTTEEPEDNLTIYRGSVNDGQNTVDIRASRADVRINSRK